MTAQPSAKQTASESSSHSEVPQRLREIIQDPRTDRSAVTTPTPILSVRTDLQWCH